MRMRHVTILTITMILLCAVATGLYQTIGPAGNDLPPTETLANVRYFAPAGSHNGVSYAVDGGRLLTGRAGNWRELNTPQNVIVSAVAIDDAHPNTIYIGAADEMAIYRSLDAGQTWLRIPLDDTYVGGVTDIAVDSAQRLIYAGTDTAGLFRLRDVGSSMILSGQLLLDAPVRQVVADSSGTGMAFVRTDWQLYRAENFGLTWFAVDALNTSPTGLALAQSRPPIVFVGTIDRGVLKSQDGITWSPANHGLDFAVGSRLQIDALVVDPIRPDILYAAISYLFGNTELHRTPSRIVTSTDRGNSWRVLDEDIDTTVAELLPISNSPGIVYALTATSRTPLALGESPFTTASTTLTSEILDRPHRPIGRLRWLAWIIAGMAAIALLFALAVDLGFSQRQKADGHPVLKTQPVRVDR